ncbi:MAG: BatA domain-containing protein [Nevskia sp.]|jgi:hypothetical protein|nr:BatA domain-containing protein [Nevskia sp.]MCK9386619.1 BatA domain-containing protein [Nevskia sp.]
MIEFLSPAGLFALAALSLPLLIHLIRRPQRQLRDFAALRWLAERNRPREKLRWHERLLLLLRLLLLAVLAALLALPAWRASPLPAGTAWVLVTPGVDAETAQRSVDLPAAEWHWLAPGFPQLIAAAEPPPAAPEFASLIRELDQQLPPTTAVTIIVPAVLSGLDGGRLRLQRNVDWRVLPGVADNDAETELHAPLRVQARADADGSSEFAVAAALAQAWQAAGRDASYDTAAAEAPVPVGTGIVFCFCAVLPNVLERWVADGGTALLTRQPADSGEPVRVDDGGAIWLRRRPLGHGRVFSVSAALTPQTLPPLLTPDFPAQLWRALQTEAQPDRAPAAAVAPQKQDAASPGPLRPLEQGLALLAALLFAAERLWAVRRRRVPSGATA